jgi:hypothetical protein
VKVSGEPEAKSGFFLFLKKKNRGGGEEVFRNEGSKSEMGLKIGVGARGSTISEWAYILVNYSVLLKPGFQERNYSVLFSFRRVEFSTCFAIFFPFYST